MDDSELRARVFISCGQRRGTDEEEIAHRIAERLTQLGYDPYIAVEEQTLIGLKENIFRQLESSEYFIFIDFKREQIVSNNNYVYRGSLFCQQEFAIASYLDMPVIAFQEKGIKKEDGIIRFLQANTKEFTDRHHLPSIIADTIQQRNWNAKWKNQLRLERDINQFSDVTYINNNYNPGRFYHIKVNNLNLHKAAINCYVYLERLHDISKKIDIPVETIEFKWAGYVFPYAVIGPSSGRRFDAFFILKNNPSNINFNLFTDSSEFIPLVKGPGEFDLTFTVISENFHPAKGHFYLKLGNRIEDIKFEQR